LVVSPPAIRLTPPLPSAPRAAASAFSHEAGISLVPSRTSGVVMRSSDSACWNA
jgi:hypothetical protein